MANIFPSVKEGKRLAKVVKDEARAEQEALELAIRELSEIQKTQRAAVKVGWFFKFLFTSLYDLLHSIS